MTKEYLVERTWYEALIAVADHTPAAYWKMSNGAVFWWVPDRSQLGPNGFTEQPFGYAEIETVTVFDAVRFGREVMACEWASLRDRLADVSGLCVEHLRDVRCAPAYPPNQALRLTLAASLSEVGLHPQAE